jgi:single-strand DNA-binding protein
MNVVVISGNLARDPEIRYGQNQLAIGKFTVAVNRIPKGGEDAGADFIRVTAFGKQAEIIGRYLKKGSKVGVEGRIQTGSYDNKEGQKVYTTEVIANRVEFLDSKQKSESASAGTDFDDGPFGGAPAPSKPAEAASKALPDGFSALEDDEDDLPF